MRVLDIFELHGELDVSAVDGSADYMLWLLSGTTGDMLALLTVHSILCGLVDYAGGMVSHKLDQLGRDVLLVIFHTCNSNEYLSKENR